MIEFNTLNDVISDKRFPSIDVSLRKGIHFTDDDIDNYKFLVEAREQLGDFYSRYGAELIYDPEGYVFLSPKEGVFRQGTLKPGEMILGQVLALFTTDPKSLREGGRIRVEDIISRLSHLLPTEQLATLFYAQRKRKSRTDLDEKKFRENAEKFLRSLCSLGFATWTKEGFIRPHKSVYRFTPFARTTVNRDAVEEDLLEKGLIQKIESIGTASEEDSSELDLNDKIEAIESVTDFENPEDIEAIIDGKADSMTDSNETIIPEALH